MNDYVLGLNTALTITRSEHSKTCQKWWLTEGEKDIRRCIAREIIIRIKDLIQATERVER